MKYSMFIGRYQIFHKGHQFIIQTELDKGNPVLIAVRDVPIDESNPFAATQVKEMIELVFLKEVELETVKVIIIPDIASVNYGRGVGYDVKEISAPADIKNISATFIRENIRLGEIDWKQHVDVTIHSVIEMNLSKRINDAQPQA